MGKGKFNLEVFVNHNSHTMLAGLGIIGVFATGYLFARGQRKADEQVGICVSPLPEVINEEDGTVTVQEYEPLTKKEYLKATWKHYVPGFVAGAFTIACIGCGDYISGKQIAGLTGTIGMLVANRDQLEAAITEKYGRDALDDLKKKMSLRKPEVERIEIYAEETGRGKLLCYEGYSGRWFRSDEDLVRNAIKQYSDMYKQGCSLSWNDFYELLGIEHSHFGWQFGFPGFGEGAGYENREGIPMYVTRIFDEKLKEDVLYIDLGYENSSKPAVYPMEGWYEI